MRLVTDIGNTSVKIAVYDGNRLVNRSRLDSPDPAAVILKAAEYRADQAIIASVGAEPEELVKFLEESGIKVFRLTWQSRYPFAIDYATPSTLGIDRLAAAAGAMLHFPGTNLLVIDAGSAVTIDLLEGITYRGGSISPGLSMRLRALHEYTDRLPLTEKTTRFTFPGKSTRDAIAGGVIMGMVFEINEYIRTFEKTYGPLTAVITGGDGKLLSSLTEKEIQCIPDLVTDGLNYLFEYNA